MQRSPEEQAERERHRQQRLAQYSQSQSAAAQQQQQPSGNTAQNTTSTTTTTSTTSPTTTTTTITTTITAAAAPSTDDERAQRRNKRGLLKMYYGGGEEETKKAPVKVDPLNIDGSTFDPNVYMQKLLTEKSLPELLERDTSMISELKTLDTDMQTLVYENYNKFISATDTIREMKTKVESMEDEMSKLAQNMSSIAQCSATIHATLSKKHEQISKLSNVHSLLKKLQFLFELPSRLKKCMELKAYAPAVQYYVRASGVLQQYKHMPSFHGINDDCQLIMGEISTLLRKKLADKTLDTAAISETIDLLLDLGEPSAQLCDLYINKAKESLMKELAEMEKHVPPIRTGATGAAGGAPQTKWEAPEDCPTFVTNFVSPFIRSIAETVSTYRSLFLSNDPSRKRRLVDQDKESLHRKLSEHNAGVFRSFVELVERRLAEEFSAPNIVFLVQGLDGIFQEIMKIDRVATDLHCRKVANSIVRKAISGRVTYLNRSLQEYLAISITKIAAAVEEHSKLKATNTPVSLPSSSSFSSGASDTSVAPSTVSTASTTSTGAASSTSLSPSSSSSQQQQQPPNTYLHDLYTSFKTGLIDKLKASLVELQSFVMTDFVSSMEGFRGEFESKTIRWEILYTFFEVFNATVSDLTLHFLQTHSGNSAGITGNGSGNGNSAPTPLFAAVANSNNVAPITVVPSQVMLVLCKLCLDLETSGVGSIIKMADELFPMAGSQKKTILPIEEMVKGLHSSAERLIAAFVEIQGLLLSQMVRKSVETRDWLAGGEPRNVRAVMKRVVEDITGLDSDAGQLFEEERTRSRSSESSRRGAASISRSNDRRFTSNAAPPFDSIFMSNIQKLFSERIEIFGPVDFTKNSIITGVIKITLKTFFECVRLRTFGKFGLQQIQVDTFYLRLYLWKIVTDENLLNTLLEEVVTSASNRCTDPVLMETSVLELICKKG